MTDKLPDPGRIVVTNTANALRVRGFDARKTIIDSLPTSSQSQSFDAFDARTKSEGMIWEKALEEVAMPREDIVHRLINSEQRVITLMSHVAKDEGYVNDPEDVTWRFVYVRESDWSDVAKQTNTSQAENMGGVCSLFNNTIYLNYPDKPLLNEEDLYEMQVKQLHEARHRVQDKVRWVRMTELITEMVSKDGNPELQLSMAYDDRMADAFSRLSPFASRGVYGRKGELPLEEIFTVGFTSTHIHEIADEESSLAQVELARKHNIDPRFATGLVIQEDGTPYVGYQSYFHIYEMLSDKIPDLLEIMAKARSGERGARNLFARRVSQQFGGLVLKALLYSNNNEKDASNLSQLIFVVQEHLKGVQVRNSLDLNNAELFDRLYNSIIDQSN
jgi:hypothetical protein